MDTYSFPVLGGASVLSNFVMYLAGGGGGFWVSSIIYIEYSISSIEIICNVFKTMEL